MRAVLLLPVLLSAACTTADGIKITPYAETNELREQAAIGIEADMSTDAAWNLMKRLCHALNPFKSHELTWPARL